MSAMLPSKMLPLFILLAACGPKTLPSGERVSDYVGAWNDEGGSTTVIEESNGQLVVSSIIDYDGERFEVQKAGWVNNHFQWVYLVPSTDYVVTIDVLSNDGDSMRTHWSNANDEGDEVYMRATAE